MKIDHFVHPDDRGDDPLPLLQSEIDRLDGRISSMEARIGKLEADRGVLRQRIEDSRSTGLRTRIRKSRTAESAPPAEDGLALAQPFLDVAIQDLNGPHRDVRVAAILDEFSRHTFGLEVDLLDVPPRGFTPILEEFEPQVLLVESAWAGVNNEWRHKIGRFGEPSRELVDVVSWCKQAGVPTLFWNKEDPPNFDWFIGSAALFDHVFTVDSNLIPHYRAVLGHDQVSTLQFSAQPRIHYPSTDPRVRTVGFAGSYYARKHEQRRHQIEIVVGPAREFGLEIWDRHAGSKDIRFGWPLALQNHVVGSLEYLQVLRAQQLYRVFLNVNSVTHSPSMCARRVFELLAAGTPVISGPSAAIEATFGPGVVAEVRSPAETRAAMRRLLEKPEYWLERSERGIDVVKDGHLTEHRVAHILDAASRS